MEIRIRFGVGKMDTSRCHLRFGALTVCSINVKEACAFPKYVVQASFCFCFCSCARGRSPAKKKKKKAAADFINRTGQVSFGIGNLRAEQGSNELG